MKNIYIDTEIVLPVYNAHPYFPPYKSGQKSAHVYTAKYDIRYLRVVLTHYFNPET